MDTFFCPIGVRILMDSLIKHTLSGLLYISSCNETSQNEHSNKGHSSVLSQYCKYTMTIDAPTPLYIGHLFDPIIFHLCQKDNFDGPSLSFIQLLGRPLPIKTLVDLHSVTVPVQWGSVRRIWEHQSPVASSAALRGATGPIQTCHTQCSWWYAMKSLNK